MSFYGSCLTFTILITWAGARSAQAQPCSVRRSLALSSKIFAASSPHAVSARLALTRSCLSVGFSLSRALIAYGLRFGGIPNDLCALRERERERKKGDKYASIFAHMTWAAWVCEREARIWMSCCFVFLCIWGRKTWVLFDMRYFLLPFFCSLRIFCTLKFSAISFSTKKKKKTQYIYIIYTYALIYINIKTKTNL